MNGARVFREDYSYDFQKYIIDPAITGMDLSSLLECVLDKSLIILV